MATYAFPIAPSINIDDMHDRDTVEFLDSKEKMSAVVKLDCEFTGD